MEIWVCGSIYGSQRFQISPENPRMNPGNPRYTTMKVIRKPKTTLLISEALWSDRVLVNEIRPLALPLTIPECSQACLRMIVVRILQKNRFGCKISTREKKNRPLRSRYFSRPQLSSGFLGNFLDSTMGFLQFFGFSETRR